MYAQALVYLAFMVTLAYYSTTALNDGTFIIVPFVINAILLAYEFVHLYAGGLDYFEDFWNFVDLARSFLFIIYAILIWVSYFNGDPNFLALIIFVTWIRGVTYFRIFGPVRYLINLLFEVFVDIQSFLIIFFYTILTFSFIFYALNDDPTQDFFNILVSTYSASIGNGTPPGDFQLLWLFYIMISLFNFIIMLNLLISILSDTFGRVQNNQIIADSQELASMILEIEMILFCKRKLNDKQFFHICREETQEIVADELVFGQFKKINEKFTVYERVMDEKVDKLESMKDTLKGENLEFEKIIKAIEEKFKLND